jgi:hypothetical protein
MAIRFFDRFEDGLQAQSALVQALGLPAIDPAESQTDAFHRFFAWEEDGKILATAALYKVYNQADAGFAGNLDWVLDFASLPDFLLQVEQEARTLGFKRLIGPMNGSTWVKHRWMLPDEGTHSPLFLGESQQPAWYIPGLESCGWQVSDRYVSQLTQLRAGTYSGPLFPQLEIRNLDTDRLEEELQVLHRFCMQAFSQNRHFVPISLPDFTARYLRFKSLFVPGLIRLAEDKAGNLKALFFCLPDVLDPQRKTLIVKTIARLPDPELKGISHLLFHQVQEKALELGFTQVIHAFMHEANRSREMSGGYGAETIRRYALWEKVL